MVQVLAHGDDLRQGPVGNDRHFLQNALALALAVHIVQVLHHVVARLRAEQHLRLSVARDRVVAVPAVVWVPLQHVVADDVVR